MSRVGLSASQLVKQYGDKQVVSEVTLEVHPAEVVGLLGPNGAGKTTTFNMMAGGIRPTSGRVKLGEEDITELPDVSPGAPRHYVSSAGSLDF